MTADDRIELLRHELLKHLARDLPLNALMLALIETHPDCKALFAAFERHAKNLDALADTISPKAVEQMRPHFDSAYGEIVSAIRAARGVRERR